MSNVKFNPSPLAFGNVATNDSVSRTVTVTNDGSSSRIHLNLGRRLHDEPVHGERAGEGHRAGPRAPSC